MASMREAGIQTSIHYPPIHRFTAYKNSQAVDLPLTEEVTSREVTLPLYSEMQQEHVAAIAHSVGPVFIEEESLGN